MEEERSWCEVLPTWNAMFVKSAENQMLINLDSPLKMSPTLWISPALLHTFAYLAFRAIKSKVIRMVVCDRDNSYSVPYDDDWDWRSADTIPR